MDVAVVIGTYGDAFWAELAQSRAVASAKPFDVPIIHWHGKTLADARNSALECVNTEWVIHLDADDELAPGYVEAMSKGAADLRVPRVSYVRKHHPPRDPGFPKVAGHQHDCTPDCLRDGNWLVIGTAVRTQMVKDVGGWRDWLVYEDWDLFQRCWLAGASIERIPDAVYTAHVRFDSRNRAPAMNVKNQVHHDIVAANFGSEAA